MPKRRRSTVCGRSVLFWRPGPSTVAHLRNNDLPGIHGLEAATKYFGRYGVLLGQRIAIAANHSFAQSAASCLSEAGADIVVFDPQHGSLQASGRKTVTSLTQNGREEKVDAVLASAGWSPLLHLWKQAGGKLEWHETMGAFLPGAGPETLRVIGAANGTFELDVALDEARAAALDKPFIKPESRISMTAILPVPGSKGRQWIDFQHDVTLKDVELAARENFISVEHLKRYTTLGMASDQGKTSNLPGLAAMAKILGKTVPEVGTTTFRPPFVPVPMELYHGHHRGQLFHPLKRLALESRHRAAGAALGEYGGWLRPAWYGRKPGPQAAQDEVRMVRTAGGILDASPLGKIEVMGPDAEAFVDFVYYNKIRTLKPGHLRYGFLLTEKGVVYDDGVLFRMGPNRFIISCSSSHAEGVTSMLESWRQDGNDPDRIFIHDTTNHWSTVTVTGRKARDMVSTLDLDVDLSADAFPHMTFRQTSWNGISMRIARVSFTGEVSFEMSVPAAHVETLWDAMVEAGKPHGAGPFGIEALSILRAEKGYIIIGKDTDGETLPHDLGLTTPRLTKRSAFVGDRSLHTEFANDPNRRQFVGLSVPEGAAPLPVGAHAIEGDKRILSASLPQAMKARRWKADCPWTDRARNGENGRDSGDLASGQAHAGNHHFAGLLRSRWRSAACVTTAINGMRRFRAISGSAAMELTFQRLASSGSASSAARRCVHARRFNWSAGRSLPLALPTRSASGATAFWRSMAGSRRWMG